MPTCSTSDCGNYVEWSGYCAACKQVEATKRQTEALSSAAKEQTWAIQEQTWAIREAETARQREKQQQEHEESLMFQCGWCSATYKVDAVHKADLDLRNHRNAKSNKKSFCKYYSANKQAVIDEIESKTNNLKTILSDRAFCSPKCQHDSKGQPSKEAVKRNQGIAANICNGLLTFSEELPGFLELYERELEEEEIARKQAEEAAEEERWRLANRSFWELIKDDEWMLAFKKNPVGFILFYLGVGIPLVILWEWCMHHLFRS